MKRFAFAAVLITTTAFAQSPATRVADDAKVIDRVAQASKKDLPRDLLRRIVDEDVDLLRGRRPDGTFQYAGYERLEASRVTDSFSVEPKGEDYLARLELRAENAYRATISLPARRMLVTKNKRIWIDRVEIEYIAQGASTSKVQSVKIGEWIAPGASRNIDFDEIARQATVRVFARADKKEGYANVVVTLVQARIFDNKDSPYADPVASLKAIQKALDHSDVASIRSMASRVMQGLGAVEAPAVRTIDVIAPRTEVATTSAPPAEVVRELQEIEDLLTGSETERRQGADRLHQLLRRLRASK
ncbi:MAG TPA: hypothetical protein VJ032_06620 [Thermoanaerobaculia bacterium]|nr:hypothetical protein [Thermoanaerobaculia bacterium]